MMRILAADIGGTHSRFAVFTAHPRDAEGSGTSSGASSGASSDASLELRMDGEDVSVPTAKSASFPKVVAAAREKGLDWEHLDAAVFAVPGPVRGQTAPHLANVAWPVDLRDLADLEAAWGQGPDKTLLINDFVAQGYGCVSQAGREARVIRPGQAHESKGTSAPGVVAVLGAGTGLGHCALIPYEDGWAPLASEAGHQAFPMVGDEEEDFSRFLCKRTGTPYPSGDLVVTGSGLSYLHEYFTGERLEPSEVAKAIAPHDLGNPDVPRPQSQHPTAMWFSRFYGRAARNWSLGVVAQGGLWVSGGVAAKNPWLVDCDEFCEEYVDSYTYRSLLESITVRLNVNEEIGLWGAAHCGLLALHKARSRNRS